VRLLPRDGHRRRRGHDHDPLTEPNPAFLYKLALPLAALLNGDRKADLATTNEGRRLRSGPMGRSSGRGRVSASTGNSCKPAAVAPTRTGAHRTSFVCRSVCNTNGWIFRLVSRRPALPGADIAGGNRAYRMPSQERSERQCRNETPAARASRASCDPPSRRYSGSWDRRRFRHLLVLEPRQPFEPLRQVPVPVAEQLHGRRQ
jgi:hypothetical protein